MRVTGAGGVGIEASIEGPPDGPPVLLMHGWPDSHRLWRHQVAALTAAGFRTIAPDLRGFGASDKPDDTEAYRLKRAVVDMIAVLDACEVDRVRLVAHDWGAAAGWGMAAFVPDRIDRYAAISVGHPQAFYDAGFAQRVRSLYMLLFSLPEIGEQWLDANLPEMLASHPDRDEVITDLRRPGALRASLGWYRANAHARTIVDPPTTLPPVRCPVLGVWSSRDTALTEAQMTGSQKYVEGPWRYHRIDGVGHWMQPEAPDAVSEILLDFLA